MPPLARPLHLALLVALVLIGALCADAASDACAEALADPATAYSYWAASGKTINDPGNFEDCRVMFPNSTFCLLSVFLNDSAPGGGILNAGVINPVGLSLCLPSACADNFEEGFDALLPYLSKYGVVASLSGTTCGQWDTMPKLPTGARVMVGVIVTLAVLVVLGSLLGFVERRLSLREPYIVSHDAEHDTLRTPGDETPLLGHHVKKDQPHQFKGQVFAFFRCFSVFHNCPRLIATDGSHLAYLNGVRVFSMFWVISGHTILWNLGLMSNFNEIPAIVGEFGMQLLWNAPFSVDSFFFLSGLLVAYLSFGAMKKGVFSWGLYYLHRYVRLTPVYLFWIMVLWKLVPYIATGPFYAIRISASTGDCSDGWWRDILYINNFFSMNSICYPVAWYLGNDMQFYVIAPFLIYLFYRSRRYGMAALAVCVVGTIAANWGVTWGYKILSTSHDPKIVSDYQNMLYSKPWMRAGPYLIGMATGLALAVLPRHQRYSTLVRYPMYIAAVGVALTLLFSTWDNYKTDTSAFWGVPSWAAYNALSRTAWAMCLAAFVIPFASGYGDFVRKFLGAALWTPLARLTFGAYLIHPVVLSYYVAVRTDPWRYTFRSWMEISVFVILIAYGLSFVSYLCLEKPLMNVEAWVTRLLRGAPAAHGEDRHRSVNDARE